MAEGAHVDLVGVHQVDLHVVGESHETPETDGVEEAEPPGVFVAQELQVVTDLFGMRLVDRRRRVLGHEGVHDKDEGRKHPAHQKDRLPSPQLGDFRGEEEVEDDTDVARAHEAKHQALEPWRVPLPCLWKRHGERRPGASSDMTR